MNTPGKKEYMVYWFWLNLLWWGFSFIYAINKKDLLPMFEGITEVIVHVAILFCGFMLIDVWEGMKRTDTFTPPSQEWEDVEEKQNE